MLPTLSLFLLYGQATQLHGQVQLQLQFILEKQLQITWQYMFLKYSRRAATTTTVVVAAAAALRDDLNIFTFVFTR